MSYKTLRLTSLFPDAYAAREPESILYKLLDAIGAELMHADESVKTLLKSHWVRFASDAALDGLGATFGVSRRLLRSGQPESDDAFRRRLQFTVNLYTGGGTVKAVLGAVRSALGLPYDLDQLGIPDEFQGLRNDIEKLIRMEEFSPVSERVLDSSVSEVQNASELILVVDVPTVSESRPQIDWTFSSGGARRLSLERLDSGQGIKSIDTFVVPRGKRLELSADADGRLLAVLDGTDVSASFTNLNDSVPAVLPTVPVVRSEWKFRVRSAIFDLGVFDGEDTFNLPQFHVELRLTRFQPLTFDIEAPYFLQAAVADLKKLYPAFTGELLVFEGLPLEKIQEVIDQTRAAGVQGSIHFSLNFFDVHNVSESHRRAGDLLAIENAAAQDSLLAASAEELSESEDMRDRLLIGAEFGRAKFDRGYGFIV